MCVCGGGAATRMEGSRVHAMAQWNASMGLAMLGHVPKPWFNSGFRSEASITTSRSGLCNASHAEQFNAALVAFLAK